MKNALLRMAAVALLACAVILAPLHAVDKNEVIQKARSSYYVLTTQGMKSFECTAEPNWKALIETTLKDRVPPDSANAKLLSQLKFSVLLNESGVATVTPFMPAGATLDSALDGIIGGIKQMIEGYYQAWTAIVFTNPLPEPNSDFTLVEDGDLYRINQKDASGEYETVLNKSYAITEVTSNMKDTKIVMHPRFAQTEKGFLLVSLDGSVNDGQQLINVLVQYTDVQGFRLPSKATYRVQFSNQDVHVEVEFSGYNVTKK